MAASNKFYLWSLGLFLFLVVLFFLSISTGILDISFFKVLYILLGQGTEGERLTIFDFRLVRALLAIFIGMGLALAGTVFQTLSHNELASPSLLGINAGAGLAIILSIYLLPLTWSLPIWGLPIVAIIGALMTASGIFYLAYGRGQALSARRLILTGISVAAGIHAIELLLIVRLDPSQFHQVNTWIIGTISGNTWIHVWLLGPIVFLGGLFLYANYMDLNILSLADETAVGLGLSLLSKRVIYLITATVIAASCVAIGGSIAFVGLLCPHIARRMVGPNHKYVLLLSALLGGSLVLGADFIARTVIVPDELLVGLIVSLIGAPYFLYVLVESRG